MKRNMNHKYTELLWVDAYRKMVPYMVKIRTPDAYGSGFVMNYRTIKNGRREIAIATTCHILKHAMDWAELVMVEHTAGDTLYKYKLSPAERYIMVDEAKDIALLAFGEADEPHFPKDFPITIDGNSKDLPPGCPVAWCGFPSIAESSPCFFSGHVSATYATAGDYLVDGVVIHGVSGGPCFIHNGENVIVMGLVSAYYANRSTGEALPGLGLIRSVVPLVDTIEETRKSDAAQKRASAKKSQPPVTARETHTDPVS